MFWDTFPTRAGLLKRGILLFWCLWITLVTLTNISDELKAFGVIPHGWQIGSGNYALIVHTTAVYDTPSWIDRLLLLGVILWEALAGLLFWGALRAFHRRHRWRWQRVYIAFTVLLALFGVFILADEILRAYNVESAHRGIAVLLLASILAIQLLPEKAPSDT